MSFLIELCYREGDVLCYTLRDADGAYTVLRAGDVLHVRVDHTAWKGRIGLVGGVRCLIGQDGEVTPLASLFQLARRHTLRATLIERGAAPAPADVPPVCLGRLRVAEEARSTACTKMIPSGAMGTPASVGPLAST